MIPLQLVLKNFLSYREASLDFRGLHTACICGANGAGKSSLLEAIAWVLWGESRANSEDDVIHLGETEVRVDFWFWHQQQVYRVIRSRHRTQGTLLEFQVGVESPLDGTDLPPMRSLTAKGMRATQQLILDHLRLDYDTFVNSAYLRQGRADEFMLKRPSERKQILADLLKLAQYDELAERAKDRSRQLKGQIDLMERNLAVLQAQIEQQGAIAAQQADMESQLASHQAAQTADTEQLQRLLAQQQQRQTWQQQQAWQQQQQQVLEQDCARLQRDYATAQQQRQDVEQWLQQEPAIAAGYARFQALQAQELQWGDRVQAHQQAIAQRQAYVQRQTEAAATLTAQVNSLEAQLTALQQQQDDMQQVLRKSATVDAALQSLQAARSLLQHLDQLQMRATPLWQRRQHLVSQLERQQARLVARVEELRITAQQLWSQRDRQTDLQAELQTVNARITNLEARQTYQQQVREKGTERRNFMERLQVEQRNAEAQLAEVDQKIQILEQELNLDHLIIPETVIAQSGTTLSPDGPGRHGESAPTKPKRSTKGKRQRELEAAVLLNPFFPPCPLCDRPLDEHHSTVVLDKHRQRRQEILDQVWVIREQLSTSEREIQLLRQEYRELDQELSQYPAELERRGQLQEQLQAAIAAQTTLAQVEAEITDLERSLHTQAYAPELQAELATLDQQLSTLDYDDKNHALARGEVDRWRWAEVKAAELKQAQRRAHQLMQQEPELQQQLATAQTALERLQQETATQLQRLDQHIADIGYRLEEHNALKAAIRAEQPWQLRYQELQHAKQHYPAIAQRCQALHQTLQERQTAAHLNQTQLQTIAQHLEQTPDRQAQIIALEQHINQRRVELDDIIATLGRLQQQQQQLADLREQFTQVNQQLQTIQHQHRVYTELAQAFGKNGIQALMIETILPQLEAESNRILARLSDHQLHIQFITQRSPKRTPARTKAKLDGDRLIETLDIVIADAQGTRPYETYSGGEAFRVNFSIRLALARLLAQRSGTPLQLLIIDEGFGSQDDQGCQRLVSAINAIAPDFACILTITHVPHFKEAFQARIEVSKTSNGSQLQLIT